MRTLTTLTSVLLIAFPLGIRAETASIPPDSLADGAPPAGTNSFFVPIVLSSGGAAGSFYTSELTMTNKGSAPANLDFSYTAAFGGGSGTGTDSLGPGHQKIVPDAIEYLRSIGVPIPAEGGRGGTLRVRFSGLGSPADGSVTVRTTTAVAEGRAGLAYAGVDSFPDPGPTAPFAQYPSSRLESGTYRSTNYSYDGSGSDSFPSPAPPVSTATSLSVFNGTNPNGTWALYVVDDDSGDSGRIDGGWCLDILTTNGEAVQRCAPNAITIPSAGAATPYPSTIAVEGLSGAVARAMVTLSRISHSCPADIDILLVGPGGQNLIVLSDAGRCGPNGGASGVTLTLDDFATAPSFLYGLRQNATDRSNVAIANAGEAADGNLVLRLTVFSGVAGQPSTALPDETLAPGGFKQFSEILAGQGLTNGYVKVEKVSGTAPYLAYGVINDQANSDGSFVPAVPQDAYAGKQGLTLPVAVEAGAYGTEITLANSSSTKKDVLLSYVSDNILNATSTATHTLSVGAGEQLIIPGIVQYLRDRGAAGIGPRGPNYAGALFASVSSGDVNGLFLGGRTSNPGGGGQYGVFYPATAGGEALRFDSAWLYGLRQDDENRTNLALVNSGETDGSTDIFKVDVFDGETGTVAGSLQNISLAPRKWTQIGSVLAQAAPGVSNAYVRVTRTAGTNPYLAYTVINDGGGPGQRSGDGAFLGAVFDPSSLDFSGAWAGTTGAGKEVSFTVVGSQVTTFSMPISLHFSSLTCTPVLTLQSPATIAGTAVVLKTSSADHPGPGLSNVDVTLTFTSSTTASGSVGTMTLSGGLACDAGFAFGSGSVVNGPWTFTARRQ